MSLKIQPTSLYELALNKVAKCLLHQWIHTDCTHLEEYVEELRSNVGVFIPTTIYNQLFHLMINIHSRFIQHKGTLASLDFPNSKILSVGSLVSCIIVPSLQTLNLQCLRHMGDVGDEEIIYLEYVLISNLPSLTNLVEISFLTSGVDFTLPTCNDQILKIIGYSCCKLKTLDISYNHTVTDEGIIALLPSDGSEGCPLLSKLILFECSVTNEGVAYVIQGLHHLKFLGYKETGLSILKLHKFLSSRSRKTFSSPLAHINNLGSLSRTCKDLTILKCTERMVSVIQSFCPKLNGLKIRVVDSQVMFLKKLTTVTIMELMFNVGTPSSPGSGTLNYLTVCGEQFMSLSIVCDKFTLQMLKVVCEQCRNLKKLEIRCNNFICDHEITNSDKKKSSLLNLEFFMFKVGSHGFESACQIPFKILSYVLHKSSFLTNIVFSLNNSLYCDPYVHDLLLSFQTQSLKEIMFLQNLNTTVILQPLHLSMATVETIMGMCPQLEKLGNIYHWDISLEEIQELKRQLKLSNSALVLSGTCNFSDPLAIGDQLMA